MIETVIVSKFMKEGEDTSFGNTPLGAVYTDGTGSHHIRGYHRWREIKSCGEEGRLLGELLTELRRRDKLSYRITIDFDNLGGLTYETVDLRKPVDDTEWLKVEAYGIF